MLDCHCLVFDFLDTGGSSNGEKSNRCCCVCVLLGQLVVTKRRGRWDGREKGERESVRGFGGTDLLLLGSGGCVGRGVCVGGGRQRKGVRGSEKGREGGGDVRVN